VCVCVCVRLSPDLVMRINGTDFSPTRATRPVSHPPSFIHSHNMWRAQIRNIMYIQGVPGGMDKTSGECSLC